MTTTSGITGNSSTSQTASSAVTGVGSLNMSDFLTLMTTQLQNQDPMNPTDSSTFLAELSQMSTVEGITSMQTSLSGLSNTLLQTSAISSSSLVGHDVLAAANASAYTSGTTLNGAVQIPSGTSSATVNVADSSGTVVKTIALGTDAGLQGFSWDGTNASGAQVASGVYTFTATANVDGSGAKAATYLPGTVTSVSLDSSGTSVSLNTTQLGSVALSAVSEID